MQEVERYAIEYQDNRSRWHRRRGHFSLASEAITAADADWYEVWRVVDDEGNEVARGDRLLDAPRSMRFDGDHTPEEFEKARRMENPHPDLY